MVIGSSLDEAVTIPCRVAGDPSIITFEWTFANSGERFDVTATTNNNNNNNGLLVNSGGGISINGIGPGSDGELGISESITTKQQNGLFDYNDNNSNGMLEFCINMFKYI